MRLWIKKRKKNALYSPRLLTRLKIYAEKMGILSCLFSPPNFKIGNLWQLSPSCPIRQVVLFWYWFDCCYCCCCNTCKEQQNATKKEKIKNHAKKKDKIKNNHIEKQINCTFKLIRSRSYKAYKKIKSIFLNIYLDDRLIVNAIVLRATEFPVNIAGWYRSSKNLWRGCEVSIALFK